MRNFDQVVNRLGFNSKKWDACEEMFGSRDVAPMWIADMDFPTAEEIVEAIKTRADHGIFGYTGMPDTYTEAVAGWMERRHGWKMKQA